MALGLPRVHHRLTDSTNLRARELAAAGAPHGTLVTAAEQTSGRGRQGRTWSAPPGRALLMSLILRDPPRLLPLIAGVALAELTEEILGAPTTVKWPNDVLDAGGRKLAGILVEGRPQEGWAVLGIGLNVAIAPDEFPPELRDTAGTLGLPPTELEPTLARLLAGLGGRLAADEDALLDALRARDALLDRPVRWAQGEGVGAGVDAAGRLRVRTGSGDLVTLEAGEVHLRK